MIDIGFDKFTLTLTLSRAQDRIIQSYGCCTERFTFNFDGLPPYTARCHWRILGAIRMILIIDHSNCMNQKSSDPSEGVSMMSMIEIMTYPITIWNGT